MKSSGKLIQRLTSEGFIDDDLLEFERLYATDQERSEGAWCWEITSNGCTVIGSRYPVYEILASEALVECGGSFPEIKPSNP